MSTQYTPGPWDIEVGGKVIRVVAGYMRVATIYRGNTDFSFNARLIAAAPELLAALETARNGLLWYRDTYPDAVDGSDDEAMTEIDAAIAKATGEKA